MATINIYNRPVDPGWYRIQINFRKPLFAHQLTQQLERLKGQLVYAPGQLAHFGVFGVPLVGATGTSIKYLDSTMPLNDWDWPEGAKFYHGAVIAHLYQGASLPESDYMIIYANIKQADKKSPDGAEPSLTVVDTDQKTIIQEVSKAGHSWLYPYQAQQKQLGLFFLPTVAQVGFFVIDALILATIAVGVLPYIGEMFFNFLGSIAQEAAPALAIGALALVGATLLAPPLFEGGR